MKIEKFENFEINESSEIEIFSDETDKSIRVDKDTITLLLDKGYIWEDGDEYSFSEDNYWGIQQFVNGYGSASEGKISKFNEIFKEI